MHDWQIWSSDDLVHWTLESVFRPEDSFIGACARCWAVDAAQRNGKTYLYFSRGDLEVGVAVADHPGGPFKDALGKPLLREDLTDTHQYDPTAFVDDDGTPYLIWGSYRGSGYKIARLGDDMTSLAESPRTITITGEYTQEDKSFLHKHGDVYFLTWGSFYATARNIHGPYVYRGSIGVSHDHGSFFKWKVQWFNAFTVFERSNYYRASGICYIHFPTPETMEADPLIVEHGVCRYSAEWNQISAVWFAEANGVEKRKNYWGRWEISMRNAGWVRFPNVCAIKPGSRLKLWLNAGVEAGTVIELRDGSPRGRLLSSLVLAASGTWGSWAYRMIELPCELTGGVSDICLFCRGADGVVLTRLEFLKIVAPL